MIRHPLLIAATLLLGAATPTHAQSEGSEPVRPRVAQLVRAGLNAPGDSAVWSEMASLLPEMARTDGADVLGSFEASRLADSISRAPFNPMAMALGQGTTTQTRQAEPALETFDRDPATTLEQEATAGGITLAQALPWLPWIAAGLIGLAFGVVTLNRRIRRVRLARRQSDSATERSGREAKSRLWAVTALAASGLPPTEIARRTGMAQDAVRVLMGLQSPSAVPIGNPVSRPAPARPRTPGEQAAGISAERAALLNQARRMRDGRITYGPKAAR